MSSKGDGGKRRTFWAFLHAPASLNFIDVDAPEPALPRPFLQCKLIPAARHWVNDEKHHFNDISRALERRELGQAGLDYFRKIRRWPTLI